MRNLPKSHSWGRTRSQTMSRDVFAARKGAAKINNALFSANGLPKMRAKKS